jgi:hypothetical protein
VTELNPTESLSLLKPKSISLRYPRILIPSCLFYSQKSLDHSSVRSAGGTTGSTSYSRIKSRFNTQLGVFGRDLLFKLGETKLICVERTLISIRDKRKMMFLSLPLSQVFSLPRSIFLRCNDAIMNNLLVSHPQILSLICSANKVDGTII